MNKVFKVIFNQSLGIFLAVSELARGKIKSSQNSPTVKESKMQSSLLGRSSFFQNSYLFKHNPFFKVFLCANLSFFTLASPMAFAEVSDADFNALKQEVKKLQGNGNTTNGAAAAATIGGLNNEITSGSGAAVIIGGRKHTVKADDGVILGGGENAKGGSTIDTGGENSVIAGGYLHLANGLNTGILGGNTNKVTKGDNSGILAGHDNTVSAGSSAIIGGRSHKVEADEAVIIGGGDGNKGNTAKGENSVILGGYSNVTETAGVSAIVAGGHDNTVSAVNSVIEGGHHNSVTASEAAIVGGTSNTVSGENSGIFAGKDNTVTSQTAAVIGGRNHKVTGHDAVIIGGGEGDKGNTAKGENSVILGGYSNVTETGATNSIVAGGHSNKADNKATNSVIAGGYNNLVSADKTVILGGNENKATKDYAVVISGYNNTASGMGSAVLNGTLNEASGHRAVIIGGRENKAEAENSFVLGGYQNKAKGEVSAVIVGKHNKATAAYAAVLSGDSNIASGVGSAIMNGTSNKASGKRAVIAGGKENKVSGENAGVLLGISNTAAGENSAVISGSNNKASASRSSILGGYLNEVTQEDSAVVAGVLNKANGPDSAVIAGRYNKTEGQNAVVVGGGGDNAATGNIASGTSSGILAGTANKATKKYAAVVGGDSNTSSGDRATILGGYSNTASALESTVQGGRYNKAEASYSAVTAGEQNVVSANDSGVFAGQINKIKAGGTQSAIVAGRENTIESGYRTGILAGYKNTIDKSAHQGAIVGGQNNRVSGRNSVVVGGGSDFYNHNSGNTASGISSAVVAGFSNTASGNNAVVIGGNDNTTSGVSSGTFAGGHNQATNTGAVVIGGQHNVASTVDSSILGGHYNKASGNRATVLGGGYNVASGRHAAILGGGGDNVDEGNKASGSHSAIVGGHHNKVSGEQAVVIGGMLNNATGAQSGIFGGRGNTVGGQYSATLGGIGNTVSGNSSYAIGSQNTISGDKTYVLGSNVENGSAANAVVLGDHSEAIANAISVGRKGGERQIKNVKDGEISDTSTDAINGSQVTTMESLSKDQLKVTLDTSKTDHKHYKLELQKASLTADAATGRISAAPTDADKLVTASNIASAINDAGFIVTASNNGEGSSSGSKNQLVKTGETLNLEAGKNMKIAQSGKTFSFATKDEVDFTKVTLGADTSLTNDLLDLGNVQLHGNQVRWERDPAGDMINPEDPGQKGKWVPTEDANTISGLNNTTWSGTTTNVSRAATEGQLQDLQVKGFALEAEGPEGTLGDGSEKKILHGKLGDALKVHGDGKNLSTKVEGGALKVVLTDTPTFDSVTIGKTNPVTIDGTNHVMKGLSNVALDKGFGEGTRAGQAATEAQLKLVNANAVKHNTVKAGTNITVDDTKTNDSGGIEYLVSAPNMRVTAGNVNYQPHATAGHHQADGTLTLTMGEGKDAKTVNITGLKDVYTVKGTFTPGHDADPAHGVQKVDDTLVFTRNDGTSYTVPLKLADGSVIEDIFVKYGDFNTAVTNINNNMKDLGFYLSSDSVHSGDGPKIKNDMKVYITGKDAAGNATNLSTSSRKKDGKEIIQVAIKEDPKFGDVHINHKLQKMENGSLTETATGGTITGLANKEWSDDYEIVSGRAATEDQLSKVLKTAKNRTEVTVNGGKKATKDTPVTEGNLHLSKKISEGGAPIFDVKLNDKLVLGAVGDSQVTIDGTKGLGTLGKVKVGMHNIEHVKRDAAGKLAYDPTTGEYLKETGPSHIVSGLDNDQFAFGFTGVGDRSKIAATEGQLKDLYQKGFALIAEKPGKKSEGAGTPEHKITQTLGAGIPVYGDNGNISTEVDDSGAQHILRVKLADELTNIVSISNGTKDMGAKITLGSKDKNITVNGGKLTGLQNAEISDTSTDAVTGQQLKNYYDKVAMDTKSITFAGNTGTAQKVNLDGTLNIQGANSGADISVEAKDTDLLELTLQKNTTISNTDTANDSKVATTGAIKNYIGQQKIKYTANKDTNKKEVLLSDGFAFTNGTNTTATVEDGGVVKFNVNPDLTAMTSIAFTGGNILNNTGLSIKNGPSVTTTGISAGNKVITNVAAGVNNSDAVNKGQLDSAIQNVVTEAGKHSVVKGSDNITVTPGTGNNGEATYDVSLNNKITLGTAADKKVVIDGTSGKIAVGDKTSITNGGATFDKVKIDGGAGTIGGLTNITWDKDHFVSGQAATEDQLKDLDDKIAAASSVTENITNNGTWDIGDNDGKVGDVALSDKVGFVNGRGTTMEVTKDKEGYSISVDVNTEDISLEPKGKVASETATGILKAEKDLAAARTPEEKEVAQKALETAQEKAGNQLVTSAEVVNAVNGAFWTLGSKSDGGESTYNHETRAVDPRTEIKAGSEFNINAGKNILISGSGEDMKIALKDKISVEEIKVGDKVNISASGMDAGDTKITNVIAGEISPTSKEVINGSQLYNFTVDINNQFNEFKNRLHNVSKVLRAGIAGANAAVGLPQVTKPGKSMISASVGAFKDQSAVAVGFSRMSDNGKFIFKAQGNTNSRGDFGGALGVGYQW